MLRSLIFHFMVANVVSDHALILAHARHKIPSRPEMLAHKMLLPFPVCPRQVDRAFAGDSDGRDTDGAAAGGFPLPAPGAGPQTAPSNPTLSPEIGPRMLVAGATPGTLMVRRLADSLRRLIPAAYAAALPVLLCPSPVHFTSSIGWS